MKQKKPDVDWILGSINWYDSDSGKGSIVGDDGNWYRIHEFSEIKAGKKGLNGKARVKFALVKDSVHPIVKSVKEELPSSNEKSNSRKRPKVRDV